MAKRKPVRPKTQPDERIVQWESKAPEPADVPADCRYCGAEIPATGATCKKCGKLIWRPGHGQGERPQTC